MGGRKGRKKEKEERFNFLSIQCSTRTIMMCVEEWEGKIEREKLITTGVKGGGSKNGWVGVGETFATPGKRERVPPPQSLCMSFVA